MGPTAQSAWKARPLHLLCSRHSLCTAAVVFRQPVSRLRVFSQRPPIPPYSPPLTRILHVPLAGRSSGFALSACRSQSTSALPLVCAGAAYQLRARFCPQCVLPAICLSCLKISDRSASECRPTMPTVFLCLDAAASGRSLRGKKKMEEEATPPAWSPWERHREAH